MSFGKPKIKIEKIEDKNADLYIKRAEQNLRSNNVSEALKEINKAISFAKNKEDYLFEKARVLYSAMQYEEVVNLIKVNYNNFCKKLSEDKIKKLHMYLDFKNSNKTLQACDLILKKNTSNSNLVFLKLKALYNLGRYNEFLAVHNDYSKSMNKALSSKKYNKMLKDVYINYVKYLFCYNEKEKAYNIIISSINNFEDNESLLIIYLGILKEANCFALFKKLYFEYYTLLINSRECKKIIGKLSYQRQLDIYNYLINKYDSISYNLESSGILYNKFLILFNQKRYSDCIELHKKYEIEKEFLYLGLYYDEEIAKYKRMVKEAYLKYNNQLFKEKNYEEILSNINNHLAYFGEEDKIIIKKVKVLYKINNFDVILQIKDNYKKILSKHKICIRIVKESEEIIRAHSLKKKKRYKRAIRCFEKALALNKKAIYCYWIIESFYMQNNFSKCLDLIKLYNTDIRAKLNTNYLFSYEKLVTDSLIYLEKKNYFDHNFESRIKDNNNNLIIEKEENIARYYYEVIRNYRKYPLNQIYYLGLKNKIMLESKINKKELDHFKNIFIKMHMYKKIQDRLSEKNHEEIFKIFERLFYLPGDSSYFTFKLLNYLYKEDQIYFFNVILKNYCKDLDEKLDKGYSKKYRKIARKGLLKSKKYRNKVSFLLFIKPFTQFNDFYFNNQTMVSNDKGSMKLRESIYNDISSIKQE
ncbi:MAG: hypothetical protein ACOCRK_04185 [bacterium]